MILQPLVLGALLPLNGIIKPLKEAMFTRAPDTLPTGSRKADACSCCVRGSSFGHDIA